MISADSFVTIGAGLLLGGAVFGWWHSWSSWAELRSDWRDFRAAALDARQNGRERRAFAGGRSCSRCQVPLQPRRLFRAVHGDPSSPFAAKWVYRCRCGESTIYDAHGVGHHLESDSTA